MEAQERQIGEFTYQVTPFGAKKGLEVLTRVLAQLGGGVGAAMGGNDAQAIAGITSKLNASEVVSLAEEFAKSAKVIKPTREDDGRMVDRPFPLHIVFNEHFVDRYDELFAFVAFAFETNFAKSFQRGKAHIAALMGLRLSRSPSTSNEGGSSSESSPAGGTS